LRGRHTTQLRIAFCQISQVDANSVGVDAPQLGELGSLLQPSGIDAWRRIEAFFAQQLGPDST
jgi:hypothetical protein